MKKKETALIIIFILMIGTPYLIWPFARAHVDTGVYENRNLAELPEFRPEAIDELPAQYEAYINDHLPFRNQLIRLVYGLDYNLLKTSTSDRVAIGEDGWLFYVDKMDGDPVANYKGTDLLSETELQQIAYNMVTTRDNLAKEGCAFVIMIAPNRERVYSEYMPYYYGEPGEYSKAQQIVDYLQEHTDLRVLFPEEAMLAAKKTLGEDKSLYHKTDTHWNELGAYVASRELLKELGIDLPPVDDPQITIEQKRDYPGDMANMLNMAGMVDPGYDFTPTGYDRHGYANDIWDFRTEIRYHATGADERKLFVYRDSFCSSMSEQLGSQFNESVMIYSLAYTHGYLSQEQPDIFVFEVVERNASKELLKFIYDP